MLYVIWTHKHHTNNWLILWLYWIFIIKISCFLFFFSYSVYLCESVYFYGFLFFRFVKIKSLFRKNIQAQGGAHCCKSSKLILIFHKGAPISGVLGDHKESFDDYTQTRMVKVLFVKLSRKMERIFILALVYVLTL